MDAPDKEAPELEAWRRGEVDREPDEEAEAEVGRAPRDEAGAAAAATAAAVVMEESGRLRAGSAEDDGVARGLRAEEEEEDAAEASAAAEPVPVRFGGDERALVGRGEGATEEASLVLSHCSTMARSFWALPEVGEGEADAEDFDSAARRDEEEEERMDGVGKR